MERAGAEDMPEDAERQGLGTPATRASILEKLVQMGFVERKGKQLLPTKDGHNLVCVLPDVLTSPQLTAEWETKLTAIAKGEADPEGFMVGIEEMTRSLISRYSQISEDAQKLFQAERVVIGKCPRCGENVYEGKNTLYGPDFKALDGGQLDNPDLSLLEARPVSTGILWPTSHRQRRL